jgi:tetratricopeptide (TPR) repeat protein
LCDGYEIQNAATLILRTTRHALEGGVKHEIEEALRLASAFVEALTQGDHFRSAAGLSEDMIQLLDDYTGFEKELTVLRYGYARSLRMTGRMREARTVFEKTLDDPSLSDVRRQGAELGLALCLDRLGDAASAVEAAKRTIAIDKTSIQALQAKVLIADQISDSEERGANLKRLLKDAQRRNAHTLASNILLDLARDARRRGDNSNDLLKQVILTSHSKGDFYNAARAIVDLASQPGAEHNMSNDERERLIEAYHFLYNERLSVLFDRCHAALWRVFERGGDRANLLDLFRRSSFIWRLGGREEQEITYLGKLMEIVHDLIAARLTQSNRDSAYFLVRVTVVLGALPDLTKAKGD